MCAVNMFIHQRQNKGDTQENENTKGKLHTATQTKMQVQDEN